MPRRSKGARLQLKSARRNKSGKITHRATWIIRDNGRDISTGCAGDEIAAAEEKLRDYMASKYTPKRRARHIDDIPIADVLSIYLDVQLEKLRNRFNVDSEKRRHHRSYPQVQETYRPTERVVGCENARRSQPRGMSLVHQETRKKGRLPQRSGGSPCCHWSSCGRRVSSRDR
jgi:hypothetical protein